MVSAEPAQPADPAGPAEPELPATRLLRRLPADLPLSVAASALRERIYGSIACLSTLLVLTGYAGMEHPWTDAADVLLATGGLWTASVLAEVIAHIGAHGSMPRGREVRHISWVSGQIMAASAVPLALLVLAGVRVLSAHTALWSAVWVLVAEMGLFAFLAVRRTSLTMWGKLLLTTSLIALGLLVVFLKTLAH